jgi:hypothetical protein
MVTPTHVTVIELRRQDLLASVACNRLFASATRPAPASRTPQKGVRLCAVLRHAVASLIPLVSIA